MRKQIIYLLVIFILLLSFQSCRSTASKPDVQDYPKDLSKTEIKYQYQIDSCRYYQQYSEIDLQCISIQKELFKILIILEYSTLSKSKTLPTLFNKLGEYRMSFDDFYKYVK